MGQTSIDIFLAFISLVLVIFISGIILFVFQYRKRRLSYEKEKKQMNEKHHIEILNTQLESQRQTMQHIGREIHDSVAQKLTLASIYTQQLEFESASPEISTRLIPVNKILVDSLSELRQLSKNLTDTKLQNTGFAELVQLECDAVNATGICSVEAEIQLLQELNIPAKSSLVRIIQEFIQNSIKHSGCKKISIKVNQTADQLIIYLSDDGIGFSHSAVEEKGLGLNNIRRRVQHMQGRYDLSGMGGNGTRLDISVPLTETVLH